MSQRKSGYKRKELDFYGTGPEWVTECLLAHVETRPGSVWEPACGEHAMVRVLEKRFRTLATDKASGYDFLKQETLPASSIRGIVTNPPYNIAPEFCRHALALTKPFKGWVAMLLRVDFDSANGRVDLFRDCPAWSRKIVLTRRIVWFVEPETGKPKASPSENHAWYLWDWRHQGDPVVSYAP
jgi:hypothetical protein